MSTGTEKHCIGLAGEYLAAGQLCMKGWIANLTSKNCPAFDIIVIDPKNNKTVTVQVKSTKNQNSYTTGLSHLRISELDEKITCPFIYVNMKNDTVRYFIVPKEDLIKLIKEDDYNYYHKERVRPIKEDYPIGVTLKLLEPYENQWSNIWL